MLEKITIWTTFLGQAILKPSFLLAHSPLLLIAVEFVFVVLVVVPMVELILVMVEEVVDFP